jgi:hypothetical protein
MPIRSATVFNTKQRWVSSSGSRAWRIIFNASSSSSNEADFIIGFEYTFLVYLSKFYLELQFEQFFPSSPSPLHPSESMAVERVVDLPAGARQPQDIPRVMEIAKIFGLEILPPPGA